MAEGVGGGKSTGRYEAVAEKVAAGSDDFL